MWSSQALQWYGRFRIIDRFALLLPMPVMDAQARFVSAVTQRPPATIAQRCADWVLEAAGPLVAQPWASQVCLFCGFTTLPTQGTEEFLTWTEIPHLNRRASGGLRSADFPRFPQFSTIFQFACSYHQSYSQFCNFFLA